MEVHAPHHAISTWRDFFVHMSTICLGLLIALALEQSAEAVHRGHERDELREALDHDSRQSITDARLCEQWSNTYIAWLLRRIKAVQAALVSHQPVPQEPSFRSERFDVATDPSFEAAKASGTLGLLSQEEVRAYSEADWLLARLQQAFDAGTTDIQPLRAFEVEVGSVGGAPDFSKLDAKDLKRYLNLLASQLWDAVTFRYRNEAIVDVETALLKGQRDIPTLRRLARASAKPTPGFAEHL